MTAWFEFDNTPYMSHFEFEGALRKQKHLKDLTITPWSRQQKKTIYHVTTDRPEALILLGMAIQVINDEIENRSRKLTEKQTPAGGRLTG